MEEVDKDASRGLKRSNWNPKPDNGSLMQTSCQTLSNRFGIYAKPPRRPGSHWFMRKYGIQINRIVFAGDVHHVGGNYYQGNNGNVNIV